MPILSDASAVNTSLERASAIVAKTVPYADLDLSLTVHPDFHDILPLVDIDAVTNAVRNLLLTNWNEAPFQPDLGGNLGALLFEPADQFTVFAIQQYIKNCLIKFEPRISQIVVQVVDDSDNNRYAITLGFNVITLTQNVDMTIYLDRIR